jgi:hypothetical protein
MAHDHYFAKMSVEEAKVRLLNPPPEFGSPPSWLRSNAIWLVPAAAAAAALLVARPRRGGSLGGRALSLVTSPLIHRAALSFVTNLSRRYAAY